MKLICYAFSTLVVFGLSSTMSSAAPETAKIVFTSTRDGNSEIYIMNPDGSEQINLTQHRAGDNHPVWAPTGDHILFVSDRNGTKDLYLMKADGTNVRKVFRRLVGREHPTWAPDGKQIAYHRFNRLSIYIASSDGTGEEKLVDGLWPAWAPNGSEIAFIADEKFAVVGDGRLKAEKPRVQIIHLQTSAKETLLPGKDLMFNPAWAPKSNRIAFSWINLDAIPVEDLLAGKNAGDTIGVYVVNRDGSGLKEIAAGEDGTTFNPTWSPRGDELIYDKQIREVKQLFKIASGGGIPEQLTHRGNNFEADWFDPAFALPVLPQPHLLTTVWGKLKTQD